MPADQRGAGPDFAGPAPLTPPYFGIDRAHNTNRNRRPTSQQDNGQTKQTMPTTTTTQQWVNTLLQLSKGNYANPAQNRAGITITLEDYKRNCKAASTAFGVATAEHIEARAEVGENINFEDLAHLLHGQQDEAAQAAHPAFATVVDKCARRALAVFAAGEGYPLDSFYKAGLLTHAARWFPNPHLVTDNEGKWEGEPITPPTSPKKDSIGPLQKGA